jgi:flagellar hook assembly protein FlgD
MRSTVEQGKALSTLQFRSVTPNPFSGSLRLQYEVPAAGGDVSLRIYDLAGRLVARPVAGPHKGGVYNSQWNAIGRDGHRVPPGVYMVQLQMGPKSVLRRVVLTR